MVFLMDQYYDQDYLLLILMICVMYLHFLCISYFQMTQLSLDLAMTFSY